MSTIGKEAGKMSKAQTESFHTAFVTHDRVAEKEAWVCAARGRMRRAILYRKHAEDYERAGRLEDYRRCKAEAEKSAKRAWDALSLARLQKTYHETIKETAQ